MPGIDVLLDTNILIAILNGEHRAVHAVQQKRGIGLPVIVFGETYYGYLNSDRMPDNISRLEAFAQNCTFVDIDVETARVAARIRHNLKTIGIVIPDNDVWIAATATRWKVPLATRDRHFAHVNGLTLEAW